MNHIRYAFVEKELYDKGNCNIDVYTSRDEALEAMDRAVNTEIGLYVREYHEALYVEEDKENNQVTIFHCSEREADNKDLYEVNKTDYRVVEVIIHE